MKDTEDDEHDDDREDQPGDDDLGGADFVSGLVFAGMSATAAASGDVLPLAALPVIDFVREVVNRRAFMQVLRETTDVKQLHDRVTRDPAAASLMADVMRAASETDLHQKRRALARILRDGFFTTDDAQIDVTRMYLRALAPLEATHLWVLNLMRHDQTTPSGVALPIGTPWPSERIIEFRPEIAPVLAPLMNELETAGIVVDDQPASTRQASNARWRVTPFGEQVYKFLEDTPEEDVGA